MRKYLLNNDRSSDYHASNDLLMTAMTSSQETRKYITPYAFGVSDTLVGKALASPLRRMMSILLDLMVVALLTLMSVKILALCMFVVSTVGFFRARKRQSAGFAPKALMITAVISVLVFFASQSLENIDFSWGDDSSSELIDQTSEQLSGVDIEQASFSFIAALKNALSDLGLGFGWAALYFSVFTAWFGGQTLGKMLLRIKVVKLDGIDLTLWESFERYGGYSAGLATGLLGFIQVIWDANRQAIHDKIAETMVIDLTKSDRPIP